MLFFLNGRGFCYEGKELESRKRVEKNYFQKICRSSVELAYAHIVQKQYHFNSYSKMLKSNTFLVFF